MNISIISCFQTLFVVYIHRLLKLCTSLLLHCGSALHAGSTLHAGSVLLPYSRWRMYFSHKMCTELMFLLFFSVERCDTTASSTTTGLPIIDEHSTERREISTIYGFECTTKSEQTSTSSLILDDFTNNGVMTTMSSETQQGTFIINKSLCKPYFALIFTHFFLIETTPSFDDVQLENVRNTKSMGLWHTNTDENYGFQFLILLSILSLSSFVQLILTVYTFTRVNQNSQQKVKKETLV